MHITSLQIQSLRNLSQIAISPDSGLNCLIGPNGSGKSSFIEAIYLLGYGRSFRSSQLNRVIQHHAKELFVFAETQNLQGLHNKLGYSRDQLGKSRMKLNGEPLNSMAELAALLPVLLLYSESYALFRDSPKARRKCLDWGMFHVEHSFYPLWKKAQKILAQRNALLKMGAHDNDINVWDLQLSEIGHAIHTLRESFVAQWWTIMEPILQALFSHDDMRLEYSPGWNIEIGLQQVLKNKQNRDRALGYTTAGPQRADIQIYIGDVLAQHVLSLGQQKLLVAGVMLSQGILLNQIANKSPILLLDDLPAELDETARYRISQIIHRLNSQIFLTAVDPHTLEPFLQTTKPTKMFHVEHGELRSEE